MRSPVGDDRTPTAPDSTPVTTKHPPRHGGSVFAVRRGQRSCRVRHRTAACTMTISQPWRKHRNRYRAVALVVRNERATGDRRLRPRCEGELPAAQSLSAKDPSRLTSSCSAASSSCSAASSSAASLHWAATSNRHHRCSMMHMHTAAATTTTAAADHQYAIMPARTGTPTLARIGCRSAHDRRM